MRRPPSSTRTDTLVPYPTLFRAVCDVVGGCEFPAPACGQQEGVVLGVVVAVAGHDVEGHAAEDLGVRGVAESELPCDEEQLLVGVRAALVVVQVLDGAQRLHVVIAVAVAVRQEERRGGKEWFSTCRSRW